MISLQEGKKRSYSAGIFNLSIWVKRKASVSKCFLSKSTCSLSIWFSLFMTAMARKTCGEEAEGAGSHLNILRHVLFTTLMALQEGDMREEVKDLSVFAVLG